MFTVAGVEVDATAKTAAAARDRALAEGQKAALGRLFKRIVLAEDREKAARLVPDSITELVRDFEISQEKRSSVRYLAVLNVRFKAESIREILRRHDIGFAETRSRPVLILPVYEVAGAYSLWEDPNPWRAAWQVAPPIDGLVPLIRPTSGMGNAVLISAEQAVRGDQDRLAEIAQHYQAGSVLVAVAGFRMGTVGEAVQAAQPYLQITLSRMGAALAEQTRLISFALREGETPEAVIARAVAAVSEQIQEEWKRENRLRFGVGRELTATIPLSSLDDWLFIKRQLSKVAFIRGSDLLYLSRKQARVRINFIGDENQLTLALVQKDIVLEQGPIDWILRRASKDGGAVKREPAPLGVELPNGSETGAPLPQLDKVP